MMFINNITNRSKKINSLICVGLDPDPDFILDKLGMSSVFEFNKRVIDATIEYALCYKPQIAHYSAHGLEDDLLRTIEYIKTKDSSITVILDSKRGDIGSTAEKYAIESFDRFSVDAVTVNPYLGTDSILPFETYKDKGVIVLAKTSNPSSSWLQLMDVSGEPLYLALSRNIYQASKNPSNLLFVVGATDREPLERMRKAFPDTWFLVPGVGAQGGTVSDVIFSAKSKVLINITRSIIYPNWDGHQDYFDLVKKRAQHFHAEYIEAISKLDS